MSRAATKLAAINIVFDKLHFAGHVDAWCHANCDPYNVEELKEVCTCSIQVKYICSTVAMPVLPYVGLTANKMTNTHDSMTCRILST